MYKGLVVCSRGVSCLSHSISIRRSRQRTVGSIYNNIIAKDTSCIELLVNFRLKHVNLSGSHWTKYSFLVSWFIFSGVSLLGLLSGSLLSYRTLKFLSGIVSCFVICVELDNLTVSNLISYTWTRMWNRILNVGT